MQRPRTPSRISESLHHQLNSYALAASAAGVGLLALAQPAEAKIVYTPTKVKIGPNDVYHLDLNHDGIADFGVKNRFAQYKTHYGIHTFETLTARPDRNGNAVWGHVVSTTTAKWTYASALHANVQIGPTGKFLSGAGMMVSANASTWSGRCFSSRRGSWINITNRYLGLKFVIGRKTHFGWAQLNVRLNQGCSAEIHATLTGYAYETVPNRSIITGKTKGPDVITLQDASLGHLARGAAAIKAWRVRECK
jgi:hypothetical protein